MHAARAGNVDAVNMLLLAGAQVNARESWNGQSPLHWAAAEGHGAVVEALIAGGADIRQRSNAGTTPFMFAVRKGDMRSVKALLAAGADVNEKRVDLATPLLVAIINGHEDLVDLLLEKGANPNAEGGTTDLSVQGSRARPIKITLKTPSYRDQLRDVGTEGGNGGQQQLGTAAAGGYPRGQLAHQRRVHLRQHRSHARHQIARSSTGLTSTRAIPTWSRAGRARGIAGGRSA